MSSCRILDNVALSLDTGFQFAYVVLLLPCLRATFDALATIALLIKFSNILKDRPYPLSLIEELFREEIHDVIIIFGIMALEAVFVQIDGNPSDPIHTGSLTRGKRDDVDNISLAYPRPSFDSRNSTIVESHVGDSQSSLDESRLVIFPAWSPEKFDFAPIDGQPDCETANDSPIPHTDPTLCPLPAPVVAKRTRPRTRNIGCVPSTFGAFNLPYCSNEVPPA
ncbi:hypothetical protein DFH08DRAFT_824448 [Mycena albidolilacea]|uniref:Uncharacterized protein n=1 Tax=Mycena albidolilacea TaxID=1033008 RepID=A0AAD7EB35_9AGAR|nr:hypothetical protein DFH08DRAFT_824448 [Mycena albidolilacea]